MEDSAAYLIGRLLGLAFFGCLPAFFLIRAFTATTASRRLANAALACGLGAFFLPETILGFTPVQNPFLFRASAITRLTLALIGLALSISALIVRRHDRGTGVARPLLGSGFSIFHGMVGAFYLLVTSSLFSPFGFPGTNGSDGESTAWVYQSPQHGLRLTLPSKNWQLSKPTNGSVMFGHRLPTMLAGISSVEAQKSEAEFGEAKKQIRDIIDSDPLRKSTAKHKEGITASGHQFSYSTCRDNSGKGGEMFVATAVIWHKKKELIVTLIFEGTPTFQSEAGKSSELHTFEKSSESILLSLE